MNPDLTGPATTEAPESTKKIVKHKTLAELYAEPCVVIMDRAAVHQAAELPGTTQNTLSRGRPGLNGIELGYHPGYGLIGCLKGEWFLVPGANCSALYESGRVSAARPGAVHRANSR